MRTTYPVVLGRAADQDGINYWTSLLQNGMPNEDFLANLYSSPEYGVDATAQFYNSQPDQNWLNQVYLATIGRNAQPDELANGITEIRQGVRRPDVVQGILNSPTYSAAAAAAADNAILGNTADAGTLAPYLNEGFTIEQVKALLYGTPEFYNGPGGGTNAGYLGALYQNALGRPIDGDGFNFYGAQLAQNQTSSNTISALGADPCARTWRSRC